MGHLCNKLGNMLLNGELDWPNDDIRIMLLGSSTTVDTEKDKDTVDGYTTLDELTGTGASRKSLAGKAVTRDDGNNRNYADASDVAWTGLNTGTVEGLLIYKHVTNDADSIPLIYIDGGDLPLASNGSDFTIVFAATGLGKLDF